MEYEQVEYGRRVVTEAIRTQDINGYYDILAPDVLLVTHFPYPSISHDSNVQGVQRWVDMSEQQHMAAVRAATAAAEAAAAAASAVTAGGRGLLRGGGSVAMSASATGAAGRTSKAAAAAAAAGGGSGSAAFNQRRRAQELLQRQEAWRQSQQRRYEAFRKRRERHHRTTTDDEKDEEDEKSAAVATGGADAAPNPKNSVPGTKTTPPAVAGGKSKAPAHAGGAGKSGAPALSPAAAATARAAAGVRFFQEQQQRQAQAAAAAAAAAISPANTQARATSIAGANMPDPAAASAAAAVAAAAAAPHKVGTSSRSEPIPYEDAVTVTEGKLLVSYRFFELLHWAAAAGGKSPATAHIAPVETDLRLRKDILQEEEILVPPAAPTSVQEAYSQLGRQFTERNQPLSSMQVIWGADYLFFEDVIYFDDGLIVTVHRRMLTVPEVLARAAPTGASPGQSGRDGPGTAASPPSQQPQVRLSEKKVGGAAGGGKRGQSLGAARPEQVYHAVETFYGLTATRVDACSNAWALLDYSFVEATEPAMLLRVAPVSGHVHVNRLPRVAADPRLTQGVFLNQSNDPTKGGASGSPRTLIKARNKNGEEEAYEFEAKQHRFSMFSEGGGGEGGAGGGAGVGGIGDDQLGLGGKNGPGGGGRGRKGGADGGALQSQRYDASSVRISGCHLQAKVEQLVPVLRRLIANCVLTLHTLDLSQNDISSLPDLRMLPLQILKLHGNAIADWRVVEQQIAPLPYLSTLTLHGNPIAADVDVRDAASGAHAPAVAAVPSGKANARGATASGSGGAGGVANSGADGGSVYWKRLLALLLRSPTRVVPLRQVDFVTLTGLDYNLAGAYEMFTTGQTGVINKARSMMGSRSLGQSAAAAATVK